METVVGVVLIVAGAGAMFLGFPPVSWVALAFFLGGAGLIGSGVRELFIARSLRRARRRSAR